jgi:uncharacterized protein (TIGR02246 family)
VAAQAPEELHTLIEAAFNDQDVEAMLDLYEPGATQVVPPDGRHASGIEAIRAAVEPILALEPRARMEVIDKVEADGLAITYGRWALDTRADPDAAEMSGRGTMVSRRQPDGTWRIVLDNPMTFE